MRDASTWRSPTDLMKMEGMGGQIESGGVSIGATRSAEVSRRFTLEYQVGTVSSGIFDPDLPFANHLTWLSRTCRSPVAPSQAQI